jgi:hypothetical protein
MWQIQMTCNGDVVGVQDAIQVSCEDKKMITNMAQMMHENDRR